MFQDYCAAHGNPCIPGSLYCSEECRVQDLVDCLESPMASDDENDLLYECSFCQSHNQKCIHTADYGANYTHHHGHLQDISFDLEPLSYGSADSVDNEIIQSNYRKWLVQLTPRLAN